MEDRCKSSADKISLGQARRVAILRAVHSGARILFLDEPLAGLDPSGSEAVIYLLKTLARTHKLTIVLVEHVLNIPRVLEFADTVWTLAEGRLSVNTAAEVRTELTEQGWRGLSWLREIVGCSGLLKDECLPGGAILRRMSCTQSGDVVLELSDVVVHRGARLVVGQPLADNISGVSLSLQKGEVAVLQAPNGWGKTTLMEAAAGLLPLTQGTIRLQGKPINGCSPWERRRLGLSLLQARGHNFSSLTVEEALRLNGVKEIPEFLRELSTRRTAQLSGGEKQRLAFASAIHDGTYVVGLLDEPFSALDQQSLKYLLHILKVLLPTHGILIAVPGSHELQAQKEHAL
jgi:ABC-type multidrug transport system ATPase subunit